MLASLYLEDPALDIGRLVSDMHLDYFAAFSTLLNTPSLAP